MDEKVKSEAPPNRCTKRMLCIGDTFFSVFVVTPLVVSHWYGTWMLMDHQPEYFPPLGTFLFSILWLLLLTLTRANVYDRMKSSPEKISTLAKRICKYIFVKLYLYAFSVGSIMTWRCGFALLQEYFGNFRTSANNSGSKIAHALSLDVLLYTNLKSKNCISPKFGEAISDLIAQRNKVDDRFSQFWRYRVFALNDSYVIRCAILDTWRLIPIVIFFFGSVISGLEFWSALGHFVIGGAFLICFKGVRNTLSPPFVIVKDSKELAFVFPTRFKSEVSKFS